MLQWKWIAIIYYVNILKFQSRGKQFLIRGTNLTILLSQQAVTKSFKLTYSLPLLVARKQAAFDSEFDHNWEALDSNWFTDRCRSEKRWVLRMWPQRTNDIKGGTKLMTQCSLIKCLTAASYLNLRATSIMWLTLFFKAVLTFLPIPHIGNSV